MNSICLNLMLLCFNILCPSEEQSKPVYEVEFAQNFDTNNLMSEENWEGVKAVSDFCLPWSKAYPQTTKFKATFDDRNLYMVFYAIDSSLVIEDTISKELDIAQEDRVEVYFSQKESLKEYYCFEIDPMGRILDYRAKFYRKFNDKWDAKSLKVESAITEYGYNVMLLVPLEEVEKMGIDVSRSFSFGIFRADFRKVENKIEENWVSWVDPQSENPDFHSPKAFGLMNLSR